MATTAVDYQAAWEKTYSGHFADSQLAGKGGLLRLHWSNTQAPMPERYLYFFPAHSRLPSPQLLQNSIAALMLRCNIPQAWCYSDKPEIIELFRSAGGQSINHYQRWSATLQQLHANHIAVGCQTATAHKFKVFKQPTTQQLSAWLPLINASYAAQPYAAWQRYRKQLAVADLLAQQQLANACGGQLWVAATEHTQTPAISMLTMRPGKNGLLVHQGLTGVAAAHRGKGLALAAKALLLQELQKTDAAVQEIYTETALANRAIAHINKKLGFGPVAEGEEFAFIA